MFPKRIPLIIYSKNVSKSFLHPLFSQCSKFLPQYSSFLLQNIHKLCFKMWQPTPFLFGLYTSILFSDKQDAIHSRGRAGRSLTFKHPVRQYLSPLPSLPKEDILLAAETNSHSTFLFGSPQFYGNSNQAISTHTTGANCLRLGFQGFKNKALVPACPMAGRKANEATETCQF